MKTKKIVFISAMNYSLSGAAQARQIATMKYLSKYGFNVLLINFQDSSPVIDGVEILCFDSKTKILNWRIKSFLLIFNLIKNIRSIGSASVLWCYGVDSYVFILGLILSYFLQSKMVGEITEYPSEVMASGWYGTLNLYVFEKLLIKKMSGVVVISTALDNYVRSISSNVIVLIIPSVVDFCKEIDFNFSVNSTKKNIFRFVYAGSLNEKKDGVISMIKSFKLCEFNSSGLNVELDIYGFGSKDEILNVNAVISDLCLVNQVFYKGGLSQVDLKDCMLNADAFLLCRPNSKQAEGGFPTKLAEYLSYGKPTAVTLTSDIGKYLSHRKNAFLAYPDDIEDFHRKMLDIVSNPVLSEKIGLAGRETAYDYFNAEVRSYEIGRWLDFFVISRDIKNGV